MGRYKQLASNMLIFTLSITLSKLLMSFLLPLYTRILTTAEYGKAELLTNLSLLFIPISSAAIHSAVFRFNMEKNKDTINVFKTGTLYLILSLIILIIATVILKYIQILSGFELFFLLISFLSTIRSVFSMHVKSCEKNIVFSIDILVYNISLVISNIILLVFLKKGLLGYFLSFIIANVISIVFLGFYGKVSASFVNGKFDINLLKRMLIYSTPLVFTNIAWAMMSTSDKYMITTYLSDSANGIYSAASKIPAIISMISEIFSEAWVISVIKERGGNNERSFYENVFFIMHIALSITVIAILTLNHILVPIYLGKQFLLSANYVPMLLFSTYIMGYTHYYSSFFEAEKDNRVIMNSVILGFICNIIVNALLIPVLGIYGACLATVVSTLVICIYRMKSVKRYIQFDIQVNKWIISIIMVGLLSAASTFHWNEWIVAVCCIIVYALLYRNKLLDISHMFVMGRVNK